MYFVMKSFWNVATRGGRALPVHSVTALVSEAPVLDGHADRDLCGRQVRVVAAQRDQAAVVHVLACVADLVPALGVAAVRQDRRRRS